MDFKQHATCNFQGNSGKSFLVYTYVSITQSSLRNTHIWPQRFSGILLLVEKMVFSTKTRLKGILDRESYHINPIMGDKNLSHAQGMRRRWLRWVLAGISTTIPTQRIPHSLLKSGGLHRLQEKRSQRFGLGLDYSL